MTDRELLELAAKAAGYKVKWSVMRGGWADGYECFRHENGLRFDSLIDDGDAMRLANRLGLSITHTTCEDGAPIVRVGYDCTPNYIQLPTFPDCNAATRCAIVRAAAKIGREKSVD